MNITRTKAYRKLRIDNKDNISNHLCNVKSYLASGVVNIIFKNYPGNTWRLQSG